MKINIRQISNYVEMEITTNDMVYTTGLLNEEESTDLAKELIYAAEMLLPSSLDSHEFKLSQVREDL